MQAPPAKMGTLNRLLLPWIAGGVLERCAPFVHQRNFIITGIGIPQSLKFAAFGEVATSEETTPIFEALLLNAGVETRGAAVCALPLAAISVLTGIDSRRWELR
jgi:hypothetical protein